MSTVCPTASSDGDGSDSDNGVGNEGVNEDVEEYQMKHHNLHQNDLQDGNQFITPQGNACFINN